MGYHPTGSGFGWRNAALISAGLLVLGGCDDAGEFNPFKPKSEAAEAASGSKAAPTKMIERDVEAPDVFQAKDAGLWDGRPSLGGVWVAHPDVGEPQRVIIRNTENSKTVVGALFRRERENPGPILQVSSDAAAALGMLAGAPTQLNVTALKREETPDPEAVAAATLTDEAADPTAKPAEELGDSSGIETTALAPAAGAAAAVEADAVASSAAASGAKVAPETDPALAPDKSNLRKPFIQVGIFSIEKNAQDAASSMKRSGMLPVVKEQDAGGKKLWRVLVGPANSRSERTALLKKIKGAGFGDAYPVSN